MPPAVPLMFEAAMIQVCKQCCSCVDVSFIAGFAFTSNAREGVVRRGLSLRREERSGERRIP